MSIQSILRCPGCKSSSLIVVKTDDEIVCETCGDKYPVSYGRPVFLRPDNSIFNRDDYRNLDSPVPTTGNSKWRALIPEASLNLASQRLLTRLRKELEKITDATVLVVGGGCQRTWLGDLLRPDDTIKIVYTDIDVAADVDLFCDGHDLPFVDNAFDAVVTTAVLEHVLYPECVAEEIIRVLKVGGLLYSELPFMQQVHEGAYDFTRYTLSGHRRLFNRIAVIDSGMVAGPGTTLVWSIENFVLAFTVRPVLRKISKVVIRIVFGWLKYFDLFLKDKPAAMDGASCTYLFGRKMAGQIPDSEIIASYIGAKHMQHL
ncbi:MAG TPA: methyltransferase domain-containing protein [Gammaproteobacteria bacterium]|nr:methyltransferase domain-containing protein [Gammaproteobacteria bacterium]